MGMFFCYGCSQYRDSKADGFTAASDGCGYCNKCMGIDDAEQEVAEQNQEAANSRLNEVFDRQVFDAFMNVRYSKIGGRNVQ